MTPQFRLTEPAVKDIEQISDYLAQQAGLTQAEKFLAKLDEKFARLCKFPKLGRERSEILPNLRSLSIDSYLILYLPTGEGADILRVVSGYRELSILFDDSK
jgi:toxin ParE1/3/4